MATTYSRANDSADDDLEFKLRRSLELVQERKAMGNKKKETKVARATVSRERKLALALRALLDAISGVPIPDSAREEVSAAEKESIYTLEAAGYGSLEGIPKQVARLNEQLKIAVEVGDGKKIAELGLELERAKSGKLPRAVKVKATGQTA